MKKITDLYVDSFRTVESVDETGKRTRKRVPAKRKIQIEVVQGWLRFAHYMLDGVLISAATIALQLLLAQFFDIFLAGIFLYPVSYGILLIYYIGMEAGTGQTLGKMATNCVVIDEYGDLAGADKILIRSFCRLIPFEPLSCLNDRGWHDTLSKTWLVSKQEWARIRRLQAEQPA